MNRIFYVHAQHCNLGVRLEESKLNLTYLHIYICQNTSLVYITLSTMSLDWGFYHDTEYPLIDFIPTSTIDTQHPWLTIAIRFHPNQLL